MKEEKVRRGTTQRGSPATFVLFLLWGLKVVLVRPGRGVKEGGCEIGNLRKAVVIVPR